MKILQFYFNSKSYEIKNNNNELHFLVDGKHASLNDKRIFYHIIKQLVPQYSIYTSSIILNNKKYKIYKDFSKNIYEFSPFTEDFRILNAVFNYQKDYVLHGLNNNQIFKRFVKVGKTLVFVTLASFIIMSAKSASDLNSLNNENISTSEIEAKLEQDLKKGGINAEDVTRYIYDDELFTDSTNIDRNNNAEKDSKTYIESSLGLSDIKDIQNTTPPAFKKTNEVNVREVLEEALSKNPNLKPEEKNIFLKLERFITDNLEFIDLNWYANILATKRIDYINNRNYMASAKNFADNHIEIYNATSITEIDSSIIYHELLHDFERQNRPCWSDNIFFSETADIFFNNEYFNENDGILYDQSYNLNINHLYALAEIIGPAPIKDYLFSDDINYIKNALQEIIPDEEKAEVLIELLNQFIKTTSTMYQNFSVQTLLKSINYILGDYYEAKYSRPMNSDILMQTLIGDIDNKDLCSLYGYEPIDINPGHYQINNIKYYFNQNNTSENSFSFSIITSVSLTGEINYTDISITDENRYLDTIGNTR